MKIFARPSSGETAVFIRKVRSDVVQAASNKPLAFLHLLAAVTCITIASTLVAIEFGDPSATRYILLSNQFTFAQGISIAAAGDAGLLFTNPNYPYPFSNPLSNTTFIIGYTLSMAAVSPVMLNAIFVLLAGVAYLLKSAVGAKILVDRRVYHPNILILLAWVGVKTVAVMISGISSAPVIPLFVASELAIVRLYYTPRSFATSTALFFAYLFQWLSIIISAFSSMLWSLVVLPDVVVMLGLLGAFDLMRFLAFGCTEPPRDFISLALEMAVFCTVSFMCFFALLESYPITTIFG